MPCSKTFKTKNGDVVQRENISFARKKYGFESHHFHKEFIRSPESKTYWWTRRRGLSSGRNVLQTYKTLSNVCDHSLLKNKKGRYPDLVNGDGL